jgi:hypothetical protein
MNALGALIGAERQWRQRMAGLVLILNLRIATEGKLTRERALQNSDA